MRTRFLIPATAAAAVLAACSSTTSSHSDGHGSSSPMTGMSMPGDSSSMPSMPGMSMPAGTGLSATGNGYTLTVKQTPMTGMTMPITFAVSKNGKPVTAFDAEQT